MSKFYVARRKVRKGVFLTGVGNQNLMFVMPEKMSQRELDELVRATLAKQGITKELEINAIIEKGEEAYIRRVKVQEAMAELKRLREIRANGGKLMMVGDKKWKQVFYPAVKKGD